METVPGIFGILSADRSRMRVAVHVQAQFVSAARDQTLVKTMGVCARSADFTPRKPLSAYTLHIVNLVVH